MNERYIFINKFLTSLLKGEGKTDKQKIDSEIFELLKENQLITLFFESIDKEKNNIDVYSKMKEDFYIRVIQDANQKSEISWLNESFNKLEYKHIFLKGAFLKDIYPKSYFRTMGDIDILIEQDNLNAVHSLLIDSGYTVAEKSLNGISFFKGDYLYLEIHTSLNDFFKGEYEKHFNVVWENASLISGYSYELNLEYNLTYLILHILKHFQTGGVGVRSFLDIAVFFQKYYDVISEEKMFDFVFRLGIETFFDNCLSLVEKWYDLSLSKFKTKKYEIDKKLYSSISRYIFTSGVHGYGSKHNNYEAPLTVLSNQKHKKRFLKTRYLFKTLFPNRETLVVNYTYLKKFPFLLPIAWIQRFFRMLFSGKGKTILRYKKIKQIDYVNIDNNIKVFKQFGILE